MKPNSRQPLTIKPVEPITEKKQRVPIPTPHKDKIQRPPAVYSNRSQEDVISKYINMDV